MIELQCSHFFSEMDRQWFLAFTAIIMIALSPGGDLRHLM